MIALERAWHPVDRQVRGERHPQCKITDAQVADIRLRYRRGLAEYLAGEYGISAGYLLRVVSGKKRKAP